MKKLIISTVVTGTVMFLLSWVLWGVVFMDFFKQHYAHIQRPEYDMKIWAFAISNYAGALFLYMLYSRSYKGGEPLKEGVNFGIIISLFSSVPYVFARWGGTTIKYTAAIVDGAILFLIYFIGSVITAYIHGKTEKA
jgi:hypothetical protein